ncbi:hypothetical protein Ctob_008236 [Chrysochromulina tobinii]|uniref:Uncharacterized protein n=1 Tax=Chrysochromulina tobinii TaxID=1460289 RepID=A0A0M0JWL3_9EUKA|nr:hypothetical protein Ctob_008236 [Chrysochromulina tobinii]|eukprot:KOO30523.1 hypothetical protein Ctob_008236 [Chrysochromulina sp. CCMP291]
MTEATSVVAIPPLVATGGPMGGARLPTPAEAAQRAVQAVQAVQAAEAYATSQAHAHAQLHAAHVQAAQAAAVTLQQMLQFRQAPSHLMDAHQAVMLAALQVSAADDL